MFDSEHNNNESQENQNQESNKENCCSELNDIKNRYIYLSAEYDNYRRRTEKEKIQWLFDGENVVLKNILPIVDDFDRAFLAIKNQQIQEDSKAFFQGFELILKAFQNLLKKFGVEEVKYDQFDPEIHEAIMQVESTEKQPGQIIEVFQKGYMHKGKLLRPAQVSIAK